MENSINKNKLSIANLKVKNEDESKYDEHILDVNTETLFGNMSEYTNDGRYVKDEVITRITDQKEKHLHEEERNKTIIRTHEGNIINNSSRVHANSLAEKFKKPDNYTGNRLKYDDGTAKKKIKQDAFNKNKRVRDPYTNKDLELTKKEAKSKYGNSWDEHLAEADHKVSLKDIHELTKNEAWVTTGDIKVMANDNDNLEVTTRKYNNAKRSRKTEDFVNDKEYLEKKGIKLSKKRKEKAIQRSKEAQDKLEQKIKSAKIKNIRSEFHKAGCDTAVTAGSATCLASACSNIIDVCSGKKNCSEALKDTTIDTGKAMATGYVVGGVLTTLSHTLANSSSKLIQNLGKSNIPAQIITTLTVTCGTINKYMRGEISTQDCIIQLGDKGLTLATAGYSAAVGQVFIPIPIVGATVGALVGSMLTSHFYQGLVNSLAQDKHEHEERMRIISECRELSLKYRQYQKELDINIQEYFKDHINCFNDALSEMSKAFDSGDAESIIVNANKITKKLGGSVHYESMDEFKAYLNDDTLDVL